MYNLNLLAKKINKIFDDSEEVIKNLLKSKNIKTRDKQLSFKDALKYKFMSTYKNETQHKVVADLNFGSVRNIKIIIIIRNKKYHLNIMKTF